MYLFLIQLFLCCIAFCLAAGIFNLIARILRKHLSAHLCYYLKVLPYFALIFPVCSHFFPGNSSVSFLDTLTLKNLLAVEGSTKSLAPSALPVDDRAFPVSGGLHNFISFGIFGLWLLGVLFCAVLFVLSLRHIHQLRRHASVITDAATTGCFSKCLARCGMKKRHILLLSSSQIDSPISFGVFSPCVMLPEDCSASLKLSAGQLSHILMHELLHIKHLDMAIVHFIRIVSLFYWFFPVLSLHGKKLTEARELSCDAGVLALLDDEEKTAYGYTLLYFSQKGVSVPSHIPAMAGTHSQLKARILQAAFFQKNSRRRHIENCCLVIVCSLLFFLQLPLFSYAKETRSIPASCMRDADFSSFFTASPADITTGCFVLYDDKNDTCLVYNKNAATERISPDSTYKIYSGLFALEQGIITPQENTLCWNGKSYPFATWNKDSDLSNALSGSVNWYFDALDTQNGFLSLQQNFHQISYGNCDLSGGLSSYWAESSLKISPLEQVALLRSLCHNDFGFKEENIQTVQDAMLLSSLDGASLYGKTGTGNQNGSDVNGWFIGYLVTESDTYYFATNIRGKNGCNGSNAYQITASILASLKPGTK